MIICSCNVVSDQEIEAAVEKLVRADPRAILTADAVYRTIGVQPKCGTCLKNAAKLVDTHRDALLARKICEQGLEN